MIHLEPYTPDSGQIYTQNTNLGVGRRIEKAKFVVGADATVSFVTAGGDIVTSMPVKANRGGADRDIEVIKITASNQAVYILHDGELAKFGAETAPGTQASLLVFSDVTDVSITVDFTDGSGRSRIVVAREGGAVDAEPVDKTTYTGDVAFGDGDEIGTGNFVIGVGSGPFIVTGLTPSTTYHFQVFEFRGTAGEETYNVNTAADNPDSQATTA